MNLVISKLTNSVYKDGSSLLNLAITIPDGVNALYWYGDAGWTEGADGAREELTQLPDWANAAISVYEAALNPPAPVLTPAQIQANTIASYEAAAQSQLDSVAQSWGYDSVVSAASYASSTVAQYKADALSLIAWRDAVWQKAYEIESAVKAGAQTMPETPADFVALLPAPPARPTV